MNTSNMLPPEAWSKILDDNKHGKLIIMDIRKIENSDVYLYRIKDNMIVDISNWLIPYKDNLYTPKELEELGKNLPDREYPELENCSSLSEPHDGAGIPPSKVEFTVDGKEVFVEDEKGSSQ